MIPLLDPITPTVYLEDLGMISFLVISPPPAPLLALRICYTEETETTCFTMYMEKPRCLVAQAMT